MKARCAAKGPCIHSLTAPTRLFGGSCRRGRLRRTGPPIACSGLICRFGAPWRKRSRVATNTSLAGARLLCDRSGHRCLHGFSSAHQRPWTSVARHRPRSFEAALALALAVYAGWTTARPLDLLACAKLPNCCRAGEATNPGPRRPAPRAQPLDFETQPLYSRTSEFLGLRAWASLPYLVCCVVVV